MPRAGEEEESLGQRLGRWPGPSWEGAQVRSASRAWLPNGTPWHMLLL